MNKGPQQLVFFVLKNISLRGEKFSTHLTESKKQLSKDFYTVVLNLIHIILKQPNTSFIVTKHNFNLTTSGYLCIVHLSFIELCFKLPPSLFPTGNYTRKCAQAETRYNATSIQTGKLTRFFL